MQHTIISAILLICLSFAFCDDATAQPSTTKPEKKAVGVGLTVTQKNVSLGAVKLPTGAKKEPVKKEVKMTISTSAWHNKKDKKELSTGSARNKLLRETILPDTHVEKHFIDSANSHALKHQALAKMFPNLPKHSNLGAAKRFMKIVHPELKESKVTYAERHDGHQHAEEHKDKGDEKQRSNSKVSTRDFHDEESVYGKHHYPTAKWEHRDLYAGQKSRFHQPAVKRNGGYGNEIVRSEKELHEADQYHHGLREGSGQWKGDKYSDPDHDSLEHFSGKHYTLRFPRRKSYGARYVEHKLSEDEVSKYEGY